jgi:hypothetical protein
MLNITIHEQPMAHMLATALETYLVPPPNQAAENYIPVETSGSLFGRHTNGNGRKSVQLDITYASSHISSNRQPDNCQWHQHSEMLHLSVHNQIMPSTEFLGHFHSHPFVCGEKLPNGSSMDIRLINSHGLYRFSGSPGCDVGNDFGAIPYRLKVGPYFVGLVFTLYRMRAAGSHRPPCYLDHKSAVEFSYRADDGTDKYLPFRCWIKAHVFGADSNFPLDDAAVHLFCPALGLGQSCV